MGKISPDEHIHRDEGIAGLSGGDLSKLCGYDLWLALRNFNYSSFVQKKFYPFLIPN